MTWTLCTSGSAIAKSGENADSTITTSGAVLADWSDEAEAFLCNVARSDVITNFGTLTSNGKRILQETCSFLIAQNILEFNMSGYTSRGEATTMLNVMENKIQRNLAIIKDDQYKTFLGIST